MGYGFPPSRRTHTRTADRVLVDSATVERRGVPLIKDNQSSWEHVCQDRMPAPEIPLKAKCCGRPASPLSLHQQEIPGIGNAMWIMIRTLEGKNSFLTELGQWSQDRNDAERFDQFDYAVYCRDKEIAPRERRGVGVVKFS